MYGTHSNENYTQILDGIQIKSLCYGKEMIMTEFLLEKGAVLPVHAHLYEQTGYLVKGRIRLYIGDAFKELVPGDSWNIAGGVSHQAEILEDSVAIEVFSPLREDYLKFVCVEQVTD